MRAYLSLVADVLENGKLVEDRTGVGTYSVFSRNLPPINVSTEFPVITTKEIFWKGVVVELLWFLSGSTNLKFLHNHGVRFWDSWADEKGDLGEIYGVQFTNLIHMFPETDPDKRARLLSKGYLDYPLDNTLSGDKESPILYRRINQIKEVVEGLKADPFSRRHIITTWRAGDAQDRSNLSPCHGSLIQFCVLPADREEVRDSLMQRQGIIKHPRYPEVPASHFTDIYDELFAKEGSKGVSEYVDEVMKTNPLTLHMDMVQRSADVFLGLPFNLASYALFLRMMAQVTDLIPGKFTWRGNCVHLYTNHVEQAKEQLKREPFPSPTLVLNPYKKCIFDFSMEDVSLLNYMHEDKIPAPVAI